MSGEHKNICTTTQLVDCSYAVQWEQIKMDKDHTSDFELLCHALVTSGYIRSQGRKFWMDLLRVLAQTSLNMTRCGSWL